MRRRPVRRRWGDGSAPLRTRRSRTGRTWRGPCRAGRRRAWLGAQHGLSIDRRPREDGTALRSEPREGDHMTTAAEGRPTDLVDEVARRVRDRFGDDADRVEDLVREYYDHVAADDLVGRSPTDLYGATIAHLQLARHRQPDETLVRVYAPSVDDDGWRSPHTVVDVVTDDMAFIVASVVMAVERTGFDVHLLVHPVLPVCRRDGELVGTGDDLHADATIPESFVHLEIDRIADPDTAERLRSDVAAALTDVRSAVADWQPMVSRAREVATALDGLAAAGAAEGRVERAP